ncbi:MAG TPA: MASE1 domain-containing protein [Burkholderiales bacterium]|nr:MASE1 domain-containing protein [Burkholderiales bacterium]
MSDNVASTMPAPHKISPEETGRTQDAGFAGKTAIAASVVALAYYAGAKLGFALTFQPHPIAVLWPPNALLLAGLLLTPPRTWWIILAAAFPAHCAAEMQGSVPPAMVLAWFASNCTQALLGAAMIRLLLRESPRFDSFNHALTFLLCGVVIAPLAASFLDVALLKAIGWGEGGYLQLVNMRFLSNALAALILVPLVLTWVQGGLRALRESSGAKRAEAAVLLLGLFLAGVFVFEHMYLDSSEAPGLLYAPLPFLLWAAVRFGPRAVTLGLLMTCALATWGAIHGNGPFVDHSPAADALSVQLFLLASGVSLFLFSSVMEEHKNDRRAARLSEQRALAVFRSSPDAMAIARMSDGAILDVNARWERLFGYSRDEALGRTSAELNMYANKRDRDAYMDLVRTCQGQNFEVEMQARDGTLHYILLSGERVPVDGTECLISAMHDITRLKSAEREADQQRVELMHLSRVAVLGELSGALAHELNQPLTAILSNAQTAQRLLAKDPLDLPELREILREIVGEDKRAGEIIRRLRALFRKDDTHFQVLDINSLVEEALTLAYGNLATRQIRIVQQLCQQPVLTRGDRVQLQQVLLNLIINACEAMDASPDSTRELTLRTEPLADGRAQIVVTDSGPGIPAPTLQKLFEPFFTTKTQGLGLGLSISRSIVAAHSGQILAHNNVGRGATFRIELPGAA